MDTACRVIGERKAKTNNATRRITTFKLPLDQFAINQPITM
jgi:hypothetical protein